MEKSPKSHVEAFKDFIKKTSDKDRLENGDIVRTTKYYVPLYRFLSTRELASMNDYLKRIAASLEVIADAVGKQDG